MFDYLNEYLFLYRGVKGRSATVKSAQALKRQGGYFIFNKLCSDFCSRIKWVYEPEDGRRTIKTDLIERTILFDDGCGIIKYKEGQGLYQSESWRNVRPTAVNRQSFYRDAATFTGVAYNGKELGTYIPVQQQEESNFANSILITNGTMDWSPLTIIFYYAERLNYINTQINACLYNITGTTIITCEKEQAEQVVKQRKAAEMGVPYVLEYADDTGRVIEPRLIRAAGTNEELKTLYESYDKTYHDFLQTIGIRVNNEVDRHSGITPIEIIENRMNVDLTLNNALNARLEAVKLGERIGLKGLRPTLDNFFNLTGDYAVDGTKLISGREPKVEPSLQNEPVEEEAENV